MDRNAPWRGAAVSNSGAIVSVCLTQIMKVVMRVYLPFEVHCPPSLGWTEASCQRQVSLRVFAVDELLDLNRKPNSRNYSKHTIRPAVYKALLIELFRRVCNFHSPFEISDISLKKMQCGVGCSRHDTSAALYSCQPRVGVVGKTCFIGMEHGIYCLSCVRLVGYTRAGMYQPVSIHTGYYRTCHQLQSSQCKTPHTVQRSKAGHFKEIAFVLSRAPAQG